MSVQIGTLIVGTLTLFIIFWQARANHIAANAAKLSADTASNQLKLAATAYVDLQGHYVKPRMTNGAVERLTVAYRITNTSNNVARRVHVACRYGVGPELVQSLAMGIHDLSPGKGYFFPVNTESLSAEQVQALEQRKLLIRVRLEVSWIDPLDRTDSRVFDRFLSQDDGGTWLSNIYGQSKTVGVSSVAAALESAT